MDFKSRSVNSGANGTLVRGGLLYSYGLMQLSLCRPGRCAAKRLLHAILPQAFHFVQPEPINFNDHDGWVQIFDGKTLERLGWPLGYLACRGWGACC